MSIGKRGDLNRALRRRIGVPIRRDDTPSGPDRRGVPLNGSLEKGMQILRAFVEVDEPFRLTDIATLTGLQPSAAQRMVYTLHNSDMLQRDERTKMYTLSRSALQLGFAYLRQDPLLARATPYLMEAVQRCGETVSLTELHDRDVFYVARIPGHYGISADVLIGAWFPAFACAAGQAVLAYLAEDSVRAVLDRSELIPYTANTIVDPSALMTLFRGIRQQGYACSQEHYTLGDISIAAPVFDSAKQPTGSINISVSTARWSREAAEQRLAPIAIEMAAAISDLRSAEVALETVSRTGPPTKPRAGLKRNSDKGSGA